MLLLTNDGNTSENNSLARDILASSWSWAASGSPWSLSDLASLKISLRVRKFMLQCYILKELEFVMALSEFHGTKLNPFQPRRWLTKTKSASTLPYLLVPRASACTSGRSLPCVCSEKAMAHTQILRSSLCHSSSRALRVVVHRCLAFSHNSPAK